MATLCLEFYVGLLVTKVLKKLICSHSKLVTLMAFGYRMEAISILGKNVMQPRGLIGLGHDSLDNCGPEIAEVPSDGLQVVPSLLILPGAPSFYIAS
jgi:hypothetical protein